MLRTVIQYSELPFENAVVENVTVIAVNERREDYPIDIIQDNLFERKQLARKSASEFLNNPPPRCLLWVGPAEAADGSRPNGLPA